MSGFLQHGIGDLLYETSQIAFDTATGLFVNPQTKTTYGSTPPAGGWPVSWYQDSSGKIQVPTGPGAVAQDAQAAKEIAATVVQQLAAEGTPAPSSASATTTPASGSPLVTGPSSGDVLYNIPSTNASVDLTTLWHNYWWLILIAGAATFLFFRSE